MRINDKSIGGLFQYNTGITYEPNDLIMDSQGIIYHVNKLFNSSNQRSDISKYCTPYLEYVSYKKSGDKGPLTPSGFNLLFNEYIKGITDQGIESISLDKPIEDSDIYDLKDTGIYRVVVNVENKNNKFTRYYILRVYKTPDCVVQELIMYYDSLHESNYSIQISTIDKKGVVKTSHQSMSYDMTPIIIRLKEYRELIQSMYHSGLYFYRVPEIELIRTIHDDKDVVTFSTMSNIKVANIIQVNIGKLFDEESDTWDIKTIWFDMTDLTMVNLRNYDKYLNYDFQLKTKGAEVTIINNSGVFSKSTEWKIMSILSSKPIQEIKRN